MKLSLQPSLRRAQRGYSLIELSIALAILSVVIVGALLGVQRILDNNRANQVLRQVPFSLSGLITATTSTSNSFTGLTTEQLAQFGNFPDGTVTAGVGDAASIINPFGGRYLAGANAAAFAGADIGQGVFYSITGTSANMCTTLVNGLAPIARALWVGASPAAPAKRTAAPAGFSNPKSGPADGITLAELTTACAVAGPHEIVVFMGR